jgi:hypothetical protein
MIRRETEKDKMLQKLKSFVLNGFNDGAKKEFRHFLDKNDQLEYDCGCLLLNDRIIIPEKLQHLILKLFHSNHLGITRMKQVARKYVYWKGINKDIEKYVENCENCQVLRKDDAKKMVGKWPEAKFSFERVHVDFFHFRGKEFLILVDAFSRWLEVQQMNKSNAEAVLRELEEIFRVFGFPKELVSDNGPPFSSYDFNSKLEKLGIKVTKSPPYHPQSNGLAERAVQSVKTVLRKFVNEFQQNFQINKALKVFLMNYRNLPCTEGFTPAERIFKFTPRTELTKLKLDKKSVMNSSKFDKNLEKNELKSKNCKKTQEIYENVKENSKNKSKKFEIGENVLYLSRSPGHVVGLKQQ